MTLLAYTFNKQIELHTSKRESLDLTTKPWTMNNNRPTTTTSLKTNDTDRQAHTHTHTHMHTYTVRCFVKDCNCCQFNNCNEGEMDNFLVTRVIRGQWNTRDYVCVCLCEYQPAYCCCCKWL